MDHYPITAWFVGNRHETWIDAGRVYRAAEGWVLCLYSCANYREAARKLANPYLLPVAKKACAMLAGNRHALSKVFFRKKDRAVREQLHDMPDSGGCNEGACQITKQNQTQLTNE